MSRCEWPACRDGATARGFCGRHYRRMYRASRPAPVPGHDPIVTAAPTLATSKQGARGVPHTTMLRCTCGWHGGQVSTLSPGNGGRARPATQAHKRHLGHVLAGVDDRHGVPWWLTVEQAVTEAGPLEETA